MKRLFALLAASALLVVPRGANVPGAAVGASPSPSGGMVRLKPDTTYRPAWRHGSNRYTR